MLFLILSSDSDSFDVFLLSHDELNESNMSFLIEFVVLVLFN